MSLSLRAEIIKVVIQYLPQVSRASYYNDKSYTQSLYVETACDHLNMNYLGMSNWDKEELHEFAHQAIVREYENITKTHKQVSA
ncbi:MULTISPECIES: hypothetical protein [Burkholderiaceae]|uniref:hypothetical protein n=1 Tax=Burkholderiaceae TaxID=119060 RepID=UPI000B0660D6|nr:MULTISPECIES: hypothetical protein [Burkholderiaceae]